MCRANWQVASRISLDDRAGQAVGRDRAGRIAAVHAGLLDVLHDAADDHLLAVGDGVDVDFGGVFQEAVDQHRLALGDHEGRGHETLELAGIVADFHRPAAQHEARPHEHRIADLGHFDAGLGHVPRDAVGRLLEVQPLQHLGELLAVLGVFDRIDARADDRHARVGKRPGQVQRRLPAELHDHAVGLDAVADIEHVFGGQRLEEQQVAGVVVGRDGLGVRVDHDRLDAQLAEGEAGVAAAVVELDALADAVGPAAEDHHPPLARACGAGFRLRLRRSNSNRACRPRTRRRRCRPT